MAEDWIESPLTLPPQITPVCSLFLCEHVAYHDLIASIFSTSEYADNAALTIGQLCQVVCHDSEREKERDKRLGPFTATTAIFLPLLAEMVWCRGVDNFLTYLSQLLGMIFRKKPEMLRSAKTERLDVILGFSSLESLIDYLAEKRVNDLAYQGLHSLDDTLQAEIGFPLFPDAERKKRAILIVETRNLIVHNRSIVNDLYIKRTRADWVTAGCKEVVGLECAMRCLRFLAAAVLDIDVRAQSKFSLDVSPLKAECNKCVSKADVSKGYLAICHRRGEHVKAPPEQ